MATIHELATMLKELDDQLTNCMKCGMCQAVCPLFGQTMFEADVARGKLALLEGLAHEILKDPAGVNEKLQRCLLCGTCEKNCPSGVHVIDIFLKARAILTGYFGLSPAKRVIFRQLLTRPKTFNMLLSIGGKFQGFFTKSANEILGTSCARFQAPVIADRHFPNLAAKSFHKQMPYLNEPAGASGIRVAFYPGCVMDKIYPNVAAAVVKVLRHHGVGIYMPDGQACCGIPALSSGDRESYDKLVAMNADAFKLGADEDHYQYVVTPCATCTSTLKELWPSISSSEELKQRVKPFAGKVMDISQFLVDVLGVKALEGQASTDGLTVTYHDPCHLKNALGVTEQPRTLIKATRGVSFVELPDAGVCCGSGGSFNLQHYELSRKIGEQKAENIMSTKAQVAATSCPACMMQMQDMLSHKHAGIKVKHVIELYADSLS